MAISDRDAAGIILDLLKDRVVGDESNYTPGKIDRFNPSAANNIFQDFWSARERPGNPTPEEGATNFLNRFREFILANAETATGPPAGKAAENAARASARARFQADFGS